MKNKTVIIITGPTASGKTAISLELANHFNTSIISADSRQCFKELNIGVAKPTNEELASIKHYFINSHSINDEMNAGIFEMYALKKAAEIFEKNDIAIMVGGTGLYIKAFCEGIDVIPEIPKKIRQNIIKRYEVEGIDFLQKELQQKDTEYYKNAEQQNPQRLMRALEVFEATGKSILSFHSSKKKKRDFAIKKFGVDISKEILHENINNRVDKMISDGLIDEVKNLLSQRHLNALQTVGYKEVFDFFDKKISLEEAIKQIKTNTKHYAKRQLTWFKKDKSISWLKYQNFIEKFSKIHS